MLINFYYTWSNIVWGKYPIINDFLLFKSFFILNNIDHFFISAITASNAAFRNVDNGKCTPLLPQYHIDYEQCVTVSSEGKDGGSVDKWRPWRVQCPTAGPMVSVSLHRRRRIHTGLKCCVLKGLVPE